MLDYKILSSKPTIESADGDTMYDLLTDTCVIDDTLYGDVLIVNQYYVARPDLISFAVYGSDKYADIICKVNGISNPFELNEGTIITLPSYDYISQIIIYNKSASELVSDDETEIAANKLSETQKLNNESRSPAQQTVGDTNYVVDKLNKIVYY